MEAENVAVIKGIFEELCNTMENLSTLTVKLKKGKEGKTILDYSTTNVGEQKKEKKDKDKEVKKGKPSAKASTNKKDKKKTRFDDDDE